MFGINEPQFKYVHITTATTTTVKTGSGILHAVVINAPGTTNTITISDGAATVGIITTPATVGASIIYDIVFNTSLSITTSATCDLTISYT